MNNVNFMHIRFSDKHGYVTNNGGITIAYQERNPQKFVFAVAKCSDKDNYNKAYGRAKSAGRLNSSNYQKMFAGDFESFRQHILNEF